MINMDRVIPPVIVIAPPIAKPAAPVYGVSGVVDDAAKVDVHRLNYKDILNSVESFLSLDISVRGTGWVMWRDGKLTYGRLKLQAEEEVARVAEFDAWLIKLINGYAFEYFFVEDVIQSMNFKTVRSLIALNSQLEMMIYKGEVATPKEFFKCGNNVWKKDLRGIAGGDTVVLKGVDYISGNDKERTKACLTALGVNIEALKGKEYTDKQVEDICDAFGMALGTIGVHVNKLGVSKPAKIQNTDIRKGYKIRQFATLEEAQKSAKRCSKKGTVPIVELDIMNDANVKSIVPYMQKQLCEQPEALYIVHTPVAKCCNVLLLKNLSVELDAYYLTITKA